MVMTMTESLMLEVLQAKVARVWRAFELYRAIVGEMSSASACRAKGGWGIAVDDDGLARRWQTLRIREMAIADWFAQHFEEEQC